MQFVWRGVDFITSVDGLNAMFPFLTGSMVLSIGMDILFVVLDVPRVHIMPISLKLSAIVFGSFLCRAGLELVLGRSLGIKVRTEQYVANALSRQDVVRAAILYHYPVPDKIRADHEPTPAQRQLAARLALEPRTLPTTWCRSTATTQRMWCCSPSARASAGPRSCGPRRSRVRSARTILAKQINYSRKYTRLC